MQFGNSIAPQGWRQLSLEDICLKITSGGTPNRKNPDFYNNGEILWVKTKELNNYFIYDTEEKITKDALNKSSAKLLPKDTILLAMYGATVGELGILSKEMACNQACCALIINPKIADFRFVFYLLKLYKENIKGLATGAAQQNLSATTVKGFTFNFPPLVEQQEIADFLFGIDDKIQLNTQTNQTLEHIAQAIYKSWFVEYEPTRAKAAVLAAGGNKEEAETAAMTAISGKNAAELAALAQNHPVRYQQLADLAAAFPAALVPTDDFGEIPEGWEICTLKECSRKIQNGGTPKRGNAEFWDDGTIPWLSSGEVCNNKILIKSKEFITQSGLDNSSAKLVPSHSTLVAIYASPTAGKCSFCAFESTTNQAVCAVVPKSGYQYFNYFYLQRQEQYYVSQASGSAQQNISKKIVEETPIFQPTKEILGAFNKIIQPIMDKQISNLIENSKLEETRDSLLPKLINNELKRE